MLFQKHGTETGAHNQEATQAQKNGSHNLWNIDGNRPAITAGITHKQSHEAQTIAANPEIVEWIKAEAIMGNI